MCEGILNGGLIYIDELSLQSDSCSSRGDDQILGFSHLSEEEQKEFQKLLSGDGDSFGFCPKKWAREE